MSGRLEEAETRMDNRPQNDINRSVRNFIYIYLRIDETRDEKSFRTEINITSFAQLLQKGSKREQRSGKIGERGVNKKGGERARRDGGIVMEQARWGRLGSVFIVWDILRAFH